MSYHPIRNSRKETKFHSSKSRAHHRYQKKDLGTYKKKTQFITEKMLDFLAQQAQELDMGYSND